MLLFQKTLDRFPGGFLIVWSLFKSALQERSRGLTKIEERHPESRKGDGEMPLAGWMLIDEDQQDQRALGWLALKHSSRLGCRGRE